MAVSQQSRATGNDPLAELARLIGQEDPFREMEREARALRRREAPSIAAGQSGQELISRQSAVPSRDDAQIAGERRRSKASFVGEPAHHQGFAGAEHESAEELYGQGVDTEGHYEDGEIPFDDEDEDMAPPRRRSGTVMVVAVLGLALVGAGAVYGYRSWTIPSTAGQAPVIKAKSEPAKIVPTAQNAETPTTKIYDRVVDRGQNDKLVPREEAPIDMKDVVGTTSPRVIPQPTAPAAAPSGAQQQHALAVGEPKKVKTIAIRPDMSIAPTSAATAPRNVAAPAASSGPAAPPAAIPPRVIPMPSAAPVAPVQTAAATPTTTATELGGYLVQVSSQRSESDAQISFRALQAKFPNLLGGWQPIIRRADLGDKGVFYRAQIGPFATAEQAQDVCGSLKAAGGQCIVHKN